MPYGTDKIRNAIDGLEEWVKEKEENLFITDYLSSVHGLNIKAFDSAIQNMPYLKEEWESKKILLKNKLMRLGLFRKTDASLTKFILQNAYKMADRTEETHKIQGIDLSSLIDFDNE